MKISSQRMLAAVLVSTAAACAQPVEIGSDDVVFADPDASFGGSGGAAGEGGGGSGGSGIGQGGSAPQGGTGGTFGGSTGQGGSGFGGSASGGSAGAGVGGTGGGSAGASGAAGQAGAAGAGGGGPTGNCVETGSVNGIITRVFYTETSAANQIGMTLAIQNTGAQYATSDLTVRYWFTPGTTATFDFACDFAQAGGTTITDLVGVTFGTNAAQTSAFAEISVSRPEDIGTGINQIQLRLFTDGFQALTHTDDFSFLDNATNVEHENISAYVDGVQVFGCEPP